MKRFLSRFLILLGATGLLAPASVPPPATWGPHRGVNVGPHITEQDIADLAKTKATLVRASFGAIPFVNKTPPYEFNEDAFNRLRSIVDWCEKHGLKVIVDPHTAPGMRRAWTCYFEDEFWQDKKWHAYLIGIWKRIATEYKDRGDVIAGYDLLNEPVAPLGPPEGPGDWNHLAAVLVRTIRETGDRHTIIVEPAATKNEQGEYLSRLRSLRLLKLPPDDNLVVSPHTYQPHAFSHQGAEGNPAGVRYPGVIAGREWNRAALAESLEIISEFQARTKVSVFIGEFSVSRFAGPEGDHYLDDLISLFEERGWSWAYHDYRTSDEWDPEMSTPDFTKTPRDPDAPRMKLLKKYFAAPLPAPAKARP